MTFVGLTDFATGKQVWISVDHICMVYVDEEMSSTCIMTTSGCAAWVKESVEEVIDAITEEDDDEQD